MMLLLQAFEIKSITKNKILIKRKLQTSQNVNSNSSDYANDSVQKIQGAPSKRLELPKTKYLQKFVLKRKLQMTPKTPQQILKVDR